MRTKHFTSLCLWILLFFACPHVSLAIEHGLGAGWAGSTMISKNHVHYSYSNPIYDFFLLGHSSKDRDIYLDFSYTRQVVELQNLSTPKFLHFYQAELGFEDKNGHSFIHYGLTYGKVMTSSAGFSESQEKAFNYYGVTLGIGIKFIPLDIFSSRLMYLFEYDQFSGLRYKRTRHLFVLQIPLGDI